MPADPTPASLRTNGHALSGPAPVVVIGSERSCFGEMPEPERSALAAADVVLHEPDVAPSILSLVKRGAFVEPVAANGHPLLTRASGIARARKLASEGWRVVWLVAGDTEPLSADFAEAGLVVAGCAAADAFVASGRGPHLFATALNGLAG
jgi:hypothetical protein